MDHPSGPSYGSQWRELCEVSSGSENLTGLERVSELLQPVLERLGGDVRRIELPNRTTINAKGTLVQSPLARRFSPESVPPCRCGSFWAFTSTPSMGSTPHFNTSLPVDSNRWVGPGVVDAKGGLVVMLTALEALERSEAAQADRLGNSD